MKNQIFMRKQVQDYLKYRRLLGFKLQTEESTLLNFAKFQVCIFSFAAPIVEFGIK